MRMVLALLLGSVPLGLARGWFARWFDPCIGAKRYEPCTIDGWYADRLPPCRLGVCDHWPGTLETTVKIAILVVSLLLAGFIAAFVARRAHLGLGAAGAFLMACVAALTSAYLHPYPPPDNYVDASAAENIFAVIIVSLIGVIGGWLARRLTNRPAVTPP